MKALLLAAGLGTRLRPLTERTPKPLLPIKGRPLLEIHLDQLRDAGVREVLINTHHHHGQFVDFAERYMSVNSNMTITLVRESVLLGSAGTVLANRSFFSENSDFLVVNADTLTDINYRALIERHMQMGGDVTLATQVASDEEVHKKGIIEADEHGRITRFVEKPAVHEVQSRLANAGIYCFSSRMFGALRAAVRGGVYDLGRDVLPRVLCAFTYEMVEHALDIGTPEDYACAQQVDWIKVGPRRKVCFLDRDGVVNIKAAERQYIRSVRDFVIVPSTVSVLTLLKALGYDFIVVTNQRGVALGLMSQADLDEIHVYMREQLARYGVEILDIFACTHHEDSCDCRKPKDGLLREACAKYDIDLASSVLISDSRADTKMASAFGIGAWIYTEPNGFIPTITSKK